MNPDFTAIFPTGTTINLADDNCGNYASVKDNSSCNHATIWTCADKDVDASKWQVEHLSNGKVAFKNCHSNHYINVKNDGGVHTELWTSGSRDTAASQWVPHSRGKGTWSFESHSGHWMNVKNNGGAGSVLWTAGNGNCKASCWTVERSEKWGLEAQLRVRAMQANVPLLLNRQQNILLHFSINRSCDLHGLTLHTSDVFCALQLTIGHRGVNTPLIVLRDLLPGMQQHGHGDKRVCSFQTLSVDIESHNFAIVGTLVEGLNLDVVVPFRLGSIFANGEEIIVEESESHPVLPGLRPAIRLRHAGDDGANYRIPGLVCTAQGSLLACYDIRYDSLRDLQGDMAIGISRSLDGGANWQPMRKALSMGDWGGIPKRFNGVSDACLLVDLHTKRIFVFGCWMHGLRDSCGIFRSDLIDPQNQSWAHQWHKGPIGSGPGLNPQETAQFVMSYSDDDGQTWSDPVNLTNELKTSDWYLLAPAPGSGIMMENGTLVVPVQGRDSGELEFSTIMTSLDHGDSWRLAPEFARSGTNECAVVELGDGSLLLNMRNVRDRGSRAMAVTSDLGVSWSPHPSDSVLVEPTCMASMIKFTVQRSDALKKILLFSNPACTQRKHLTVKVSLDDGVTWPDAHWVELDDIGGAYSCLAQASDDSICILFESSQGHLVFQRFPASALGL